MSEISSKLVDDFAALIASSKLSQSKIPIQYGTIKIESDGSKYVMIDGSTIWTPIVANVEIQNGDRVTVSIDDHTVSVLSNLTTPASGYTAIDLYKETVVGGQTELSGKVVDLIKTSADGKTKNYYSATAPTGTDFTIGDTWFDTSKGYAMSNWNGTAWMPYVLGNAAIGVLKAANIDVGAVTAAKIDLVDLFAQNIVATGSITGLTLNGSVFQTIVNATDYIKLSYSDGLVYRKQIFSDESETVYDEFKFSPNQLSLGKYSTINGAYSSFQVDYTGTNSDLIHMQIEPSRGNGFAFAAGYDENLNGTDDGGNFVDIGYTVSDRMRCYGYIYCDRMYSISDNLPLVNLSSGGNCVLGDAGRSGETNIYAVGNVNVVSTSGNFDVRAPGWIYLRQAVKTLTIRPFSDNSYSCGSSNLRWSTVYAAHSSISTSDENEKNSILPLNDKYIQLFDKMVPVQYKFNGGDRIHTGFISQHVEAALASLQMTDMDLGALCKDTLDDGTVRYGLRYEELIAIQTAKIKQLEQRLIKLEEK